MANYKHLEIPADPGRYVLNKKESARAIYRYILTRFEKMFQYKHLPDTIPHEIFDRYLMNNGISVITDVEDELYTFFGNLGGPQEAYYRPTEFIVANPHVLRNGQTFSKNIKVFGQPKGEKPEGVLMRNDTDWMGLAPLISRYAFLMAENILTLRTADVMLRVVALITAPSDKERLAALEYLKSLENGEMGVIGESPFFDGVKLQSPPSNNGSYLTQFIEFQQYLKGSLFNEIGLSANYNMKREAIGKGESTLDEDALLPLCENMLMCRREDFKKVNDLYGTSISVEFSSAWLTNAIESIKILKDSVGQPTFNGFGGGGSVESTNAELGQEGSANENSGNVDETESEVSETPGTQEKEEKPEENGEVGGTDDTGSSDENAGVDELGIDEVTEELEEGEDSKINDLSQDPVITQIYEKVVEDAVSEKEEVPATLVNQQEGDDDELRTEEGSENKGHLSDDE